MGKLVEVVIPALVCRTGELICGSVEVSSAGVMNVYDDGLVDGLSDESFDSGYVRIGIKATIDVDAIFGVLDQTGKIEVENGG